MKTKTKLSVTVKLVLIAILSVSNAMSQNNNNGQGPVWEKNHQTNDVYLNPNLENVGIGTDTPEEKLHVAGNVKIDGKLEVDSLTLSRLFPPVGDSMVHIGPSSININTLSNIISWTPVSGTIGGLTIGNGASSALGINAMSFGNNARAGGTSSFAIGNGVSNNISNSLMLGFGGPVATFFADAVSVGIKTTAPSQTLDVNGTARVRTLGTAATPAGVVLHETDGTLRSVPFTNASEVLLGNGTFGTLPAPTNAWLLGGNVIGLGDVLGTLNGLNLILFAGGIQRGLIDWSTGFWGIGAGFSPLSRLHLHQTNAVNTIRFTTDNMAGGNGFEVGYNATSNIQNQQFAELNNLENTTMKFFTNNTQRMNINQDRISQLNGYTVGTGGYVGIGGNTMNLWGNTNSLGKGPFSLLHLNDASGNLQAEERGYRPWMRTGISYTTNEDYAYVGYRSFTDDNTANGNTSLNRNEFNIVWSNNEITSATGSDDMAFRFTNRVDLSGMANVIDATDLNSAQDLDGRHIARFTAIGNMGLGATFGEDHPVYVKPQSLLHMSKTDTSDTWLQITNQTGTGQTAADGLRIGITTTGTAHIRQQENLPMIFYSNSIETARMIPNTASTLTGNPTMVGIGNFATNPNPIDAKLDIDGDLRIRTVTQNDALTQILAIDPADKNRVHWKSIASLGGTVTADNGLSINPANNVQLGNDVGLTTAQLINDREIPMNGFNTYFTGQGFNTDAMYIGYPTSTLVPVASKFSVIENVGGVNLTTFAGHFRNINIGTGADTKIIGVAGISDAPQGLVAGINNIGGYFNAKNAPFNTGVIAISSSIGSTNIGVRASASGSNVNKGVEASALGTSGVNYGVWASAQVTGTNRAGFFVGDVEMSNNPIITSDQMFKTNVASIDSATNILSRLKPHTYKMDVTNFPQFNFQSCLQYGFIAQEVVGVLPNLVYESFMSSEIDSLGNEIHPAVNYKSLNYNALIPITVQAVNELNAQLNGIRDTAITRDSIISRSDSLITNIRTRTLSDQTVKTNVQNLTNSLDKVKQMRGVTYEWTTSAQNNMNLDNKEHIGFIAQEIAAIEPLLTFVGDAGLEHVNYDRVAPLLVESVKELDNKILAKDSIIQNLETRLATLEACINKIGICENHGGGNAKNENTFTNNRSVEPVNTNSIILDQNLPNPFAEHTVINYNIPAEVAEAKLLFYDLNGRIIKELIIEDRGESKLTVYGVNLKTGVYTYSLIADGELIATKKMVKK